MIVEGLVIEEEMKVIRKVVKVEVKVGCDKVWKVFNVLV